MTSSGEMSNTSSYVLPVPDEEAVREVLERLSTVIVRPSESWTTAVVPSASDDDARASSSVGKRTVRRR